MGSAPSGRLVGASLPSRRFTIWGGATDPIAPFLQALVQAFWEIVVDELRKFRISSIDYAKLVRCLSPYVELFAKNRENSVSQTVILSGKPKKAERKTVKISKEIAKI